MSLENKIIEQYGKRLQTDALYNSEYSRQADVERYAKIKKLLSRHLPQGGKVLEIGAGQGDNVSLLRMCGFTDIVLNELLPDRIRAIKERHPKLQVYAGNAIDLKIDEQFDCIFQSTVFTSILHASDRQALAAKMWSLLKPGGVILWYDFIYNNPKNSGVRKVSVSEVKSLFPESAQREIMKITLAPPIGRRVGKLYSLFNLPLLRSHILAVFHKK